MKRTDPIPRPAGLRTPQDPAAPLSAPHYPTPGAPDPTRRYRFTDWAAI